MDQQRLLVTWAQPISATVLFINISIGMIQFLTTGL